MDIVFKRSISLIIALITLFSAFSTLPAFAAETDEDEIAVTGLTEGALEMNGGLLRYAYDATQGTAEITGSENLSGDVVIPEIIEGCPVTSISANAFDGEGMISSVIIPEGVTEIGNEAFADCLSLKSATIPDSVTRIGYATFKDCSALNSIDIPESVVSVGNSAFIGCDSLKSITILPQVNEIGMFALGYTYQKLKIKDFIIYGVSGSAAADYAKSNDIKFYDIYADNYPQISGFENTETGVRITWDAFEDNTVYRVYRKNRSGGWNRLTQVNSTSCTVAQASESYEIYTIRCVDENGDFTSDFNSEGWGHTYYEPPVISSIENKVNGVELRWKRADGAEDYRVYRKTSGSSWTRLTQTSDSSYIDTTAISGTEYAYTLRMITADGESFMSDCNGGKKITFVAAPVISSIENVENGARIKWNKVNGADFYRIYYRNSSGGWNRLASKYLTEYVDTSVKNRETRVYTVRCLNEDEDFVSDFNREGWSNRYYSAPVIRSLECETDGITIKWNRAEGAEDYRVYRKTGSSSWSRLTQTNASSYTDKTVVSGNKYVYTLRMITADSERFMSDNNSGKSVIFVDAPVITSIENTEDGAKIKWNNVDGADFYRIYYKNEAGGWNRLASKYKTEYTDTSVKNSETRVYTVRCLDEDENFVSGFYSEGWSNTYYAAPEIKSVTVSGSKNVISWDAADGAAAYRLYRKELGGSWSRLFDEVYSTSYTDLTGEKDKIYAYTLRYLDADGNLISDYRNHVKYYKNGSPVNGTVYENGTYGFKDGYPLTGYNRVDGLLRYYNSNGRMYRDTIVGDNSTGYYYIDKDGICIESREIRLAAEFIAKYCKGNNLQEKMKYAFLYMAKNYPYVRVYNDNPSSEKDIQPFAIELFEDKQGTCYRYAAAYACITKIAGYRSRFCYGMSGTLYHGWTEVNVDGKWLHCDVDAQLPGYGYPDYFPYMTSSHVWALDKFWYSELTFKDGKAVWNKKVNF